ncbi:histidine--tRNA ligase [Angustibacter sp. Root456]|uniref:histidine--tRNA ligase n=1 Tax=Angustibacter sp. Root456 TaxID=1736539 RepID=UPI000701E48F|nr:histidine--tRNA ligase [Angustibacter sp. Root456]KQX66733.1 histidine--tRNA ligase [Angustibacter sp. Root456]
MSRPTPLSGYPEWLPAQRAVEKQVVDTLRRTFELHGFAGIETRAVEPMEQLLRKGEIDKEVYVLRRLHADPDEGDDSRSLGLHFDLTVPFARYVLENSGRLQFPFRRYQVQKVWRGERPQEGRYREFLQADIDVVGDGALAFHHDIEVVEVMAEAMSQLPLPALRMQVNNRKLVQGFYRGLGVDDVAAVLRAVDKLDKIGPDAVREAITAEGHSVAVADACLRLAAITGADARVVEQVQALGVRNDELDEGLAELAALLDAAGGRRGSVEVVAALKIARGLDYYTGTVMETVMKGYEHLGSVSAGGRYDALASDGSTTYPGVGISFGVTRTLAPLLARGVLTGSRSTPSVVLVALASDDARPAARQVATALRARGIACELAPAPQKYGKQIRQAERRGIPYVWFPAEAAADGVAAVRDIRTGEQVPADHTTWSPPQDDLRPTVVRAEES